MERTVRRVELTKVIRQAIEALNQQIEVRLAVLFGSHAEGHADEWSDVDLAVVSGDFEKMSFQKQMELLTKIWHVNGTWVQIHPFTLKDLQEARPTNFLGHILKTGKVVYKDGEFLELTC